MKSLILRVVLVAMVAVTMMGASPKAKPIFGTFNFQDAATGANSISEPAAGVCFDVPARGMSAKNETTATAWIFQDPHCRIGAKQVGPKNRTSDQFGSFIFQN